MSANTHVHTCMKGTHMHSILCVNGVTKSEHENRLCQSKPTKAASLHDSFQMKPQPHLTLWRLAGKVLKEKMSGLTAWILFGLHE